jgi:hypothetical protein
MFLPLATLVSCGPKVIVRDRNVYEAELDQYHRWSVSQSQHLRPFLEAHCECEGSGFKTEGCKEAADLVLTVEHRADWHKSMSLWNAGILTEEPKATPPPIPALSCPLPPRN